MAGISSNYQTEKVRSFVFEDPHLTLTFAGKAIGESICGTFRERFKSILDSSQNCLDTDTLKVTGKMDNLERQLFKEGQRTKQNMEAWLKRKTGHIKSNSMVENHRKRKANFD